jgi:AraC-like DNA-binding protein
MTLSELTRQVSRQFDQIPLQDKQVVTPLTGLQLLRCTRPTDLEATLYEPVICLILQGSKSVILANRTVAIGPGEFLIVSHDIPVVSRVTAASASKPYLALIMELDLNLLRSLYLELGSTRPPADESTSLEVSLPGTTLLNALARYLALADDPLEQKILAPPYLREIHFRLLTAPHGGMLRRLMRLDSRASQITRAIASIRENFKSPLIVPDIAKSIGMSTSSFHKHFKEITATSPLQYQKALRLLEARRLLTANGQTVAEVAYQVGYESPTQFSREYARKFGVAPSRDELQVVG